MKALNLQSESFMPTGGISAEGARRTLGRPNVDGLALLVREATQNSWDARRKDTRCVSMRYHGFEMSHHQVEILRDTVFAESNGNLALEATLSGDQPIIALTVTDEGTSGLGGPTRADTIDPENPDQDFVNFVRNVGQHSEKSFSGGTYGYGKAAFFVNSEIRTVIIYTRCVTGKKTESRLIGMTLGEAFTQDRKQYTGRHWWGRRASDHIVDPLTGTDADQLAAELGMSVGDSTGTSIMILCPDFGERAPEEAIGSIAENILWYFWPKMLSDASSGPSMRFDVTWNKKKINIPHPNDFPPLQGFVAAMEALKAERRGTHSDSVSPVECFRPKQMLGHLSLHKFACRVKSRVNGCREEQPIPDKSHHVALMRNAELVVRYLPGPALPTDIAEYAGVFIPDPEVDDHFAESEPPTHDNWAPEMVSDTHAKTFVKTALRRIEQKLEEYAMPAEAVVPGGINIPLGAISEMLGGLLSGEEGTGAAVQDSGPETEASSRSAASKARISILDQGELCLVDGVAALKVRFTATAARGSTITRIKAKPQVVVTEGSGLEKEPPDGGSAPVILKWESGDKTKTGTDTIDIPADLAEPVSVYVSVPDDCMVRLSLHPDSVKA